MAEITREIAVKIADVVAGCRIGCEDKAVATAVSNTGFFILKRLGFEFEEIKDIFKEVLGKENDGG